MAEFPMKIRNQQIAQCVAELEKLGKDDVLRAMEAKFGARTIADLLARGNITRKADKRHPIDALAAAVAIGETGNV